MSALAEAEPGKVLMDAILLLETGRTAMALGLLRSIPTAAVEQDRYTRLSHLEAKARELEVQLTAQRLDLNRLNERVAERRRKVGELDQAIAQRQRVVERLDRDIGNQQRTLARLKQPGLPRPVPSRAKPHQQLIEALATGRVTAEQVAEVLKVGVADVEPIAAGRVGLTKTAWRRVLDELENVA